MRTGVGSKLNHTSNSPTAINPLNNVFGYLDYRVLLRDYYLYRKQDKRGFSYRQFSLKAKLSSPSYLKMVIDGTRNLSSEMALNFAKTIGLKKKNEIKI